MNKEKIAVLGMGAMGSRMATSLLSAGHEVIVWNLDPAACAPIVNLGGSQAATPAQAASCAGVVIAMVWDDAASAYVWLDDEVGAMHAMQPGAIAVECATLTISHESMLAEQASILGIEFVSAPMSGSLPEADARTLVFTVGASDCAFRRIEPVLLAMGSKINHAGGPLDGISQKLIINGKLAIEYLSSAEMVALMKSANMDIDRRMEINATTAPFSARGLREARFMVDRNHSVRVKVVQLIKDLSNAIAQFEEHGVPCPIHKAALTEFIKARDLGFGNDDATVMANMYLKDAQDSYRDRHMDMAPAGYVRMTA